ncbi:MAG TPA: PQQ-dependent sugar dehydrogenase [Vicinamibacterales bacterium]|nr:PQQ-dependent sugar dehydrogenase [Vicinamibacterales bacterium]
MKRQIWLVSGLLAVCALGLTVAAQQPAGRAGAPPAGRAGGTPPPPAGIPREPLGNGPWNYAVAEGVKFRLSVVTKGLQNPWDLEFLPDPSTPLGAGGTMLVTERPGRLRIVRNGVLEPTAVTGLPAIGAQRLGGLQDIALHPKFAENRLLYFTYSKTDGKGMIMSALGRGRFDPSTPLGAGGALTNVQELIAAEPWWNGAGGAASRIVFDRDGMLFWATGSTPDTRESQEPNSLRGKIMRLTDEGKAAPNNPFAGKAGYRPEIYSMGHRNQLGLTIHPVTGALWSAEHGPNGGDELNIILPGRNYGWPDVSLGRDYEGPWQGKFEKDGIERPIVFWMPSIAVSDLLFYTGDKFPQWKGNALVGSMRYGEIPNTGHLQRIVFNANGDEIRREMMLTDLRQRIRAVKQAPDGTIYLLTEEAQGALLKIEPQ